jgi:hypothetical protein
MLAALLAHPDLRGALLAALVGGGAVREALGLLDLSRATTHADARELAGLVSAWVEGEAARTGAAVARLVDALYARASACHGALLAGDLAHAARDLAFLSAQQRAVSAAQSVRGRLLLDLHTALGRAEGQLVARAARIQRRHAAAASRASAASASCSASTAPSGAGHATTSTRGAASAAGAIL